MTTAGLEWDSAPDQDLKFAVSASGYMRSAMMSRCVRTEQEH